MLAGGVYRIFAQRPKPKRIGEILFAYIIFHPARWRYLLPGFLILVLAFNQPAVAANDAAKIIEKSGKFYADQSGLAVDVKVEHLLPEQFAGMGDIPPMSYVYWYQSSNKLAAIPPAGSFNPPIIQDGKQFYTERPIMGAYVLRNALPMADLCEEPGVPYLQLPGVSILAGLGLEANQTGSLRSITGATLVEDERVGDVNCHHLLVKCSLRSIPHIITSCFPNFSFTVLRQISEPPSQWGPLGARSGWIASLRDAPEFTFDG